MDFSAVENPFFSSNLADDQDLEHLSSRSNSYLTALKDIRSLLTWLEECGTDVDIAASGDVIAAQVSSRLSR